MRVIFVSRHLLKFIELAITKESGGIYRLYIYLWQGNHVPVACVFRCRLGCVQLRYRACKLHIGARTWFIVLTTHTYTLFAIVLMIVCRSLSAFDGQNVDVRQFVAWSSLNLERFSRVSRFLRHTPFLRYTVTRYSIFSLPSFFPSPGSKITRNCSSSSIKILTRD